MPSFAPALSPSCALPRLRRSRSSTSRARRLVSVRAASEDDDDRAGGAPRALFARLAAPRFNHRCASTDARSCPPRR